MMFWKRKRKESKENPLQDKLARTIAGGFVLVQTKFSDMINKQLANMSTKRLKALLIAFCVFSGGLSLYFFVSAIVTQPKTGFKIDPIKVPEHFDRSGDEVMENEMPGDVYREIQQYRYYMDSIGEPIRPGLQDSMRILEELYWQQQK
jgi:hypothetical protein